MMGLLPILSEIFLVNLGRLIVELYSPLILAQPSDRTGICLGQQAQGPVEWSAGQFGRVEEKLGHVQGALDVRAEELVRLLLERAGNLVIQQRDVFFEQSFLDVYVR